MNGTSEGQGQLNYIGSGRFRIGEGSNFNCTNGHIELSDRSNWGDGGKSANINTATVLIWGGDDGIKRAPLNEGERTEEMLDTRSTNSGIHKSVSVVVKEYKGDYEEQRRGV